MPEHMTNHAEVNGRRARSPRSPAERAEAVDTSQTSLETGERSRRPSGACRPKAEVRVAVEVRVMPPAADFFKLSTPLDAQSPLTLRGVGVLYNLEISGPTGAYLST